MSNDVDLKGRSLLTLSDLSDGEVAWLLDLALKLKQDKHAGTCGERLAGRHIALVFEKMSTRTRCAAAVAAADEAGRTEYLAATEIHLGKKESVADTARVLGRMFDGILFRGYRQETVELLAEFSGVPVWNGLTDLSHPTQALADLMTIKEQFGELKGRKVVYAGDGRNNVATSLMLGCAVSGMHFVNCTPDSLRPTDDLTEHANRVAAERGGTVGVCSDPAEAVAGAHVVYTDVWTSMGEEDQFAARVELLQPYQVNMALMQATGNVESDEVIFLHCLPAFHDHRTEVTQKSGALEVTDDVFEAPFSKVFDQAENRLHTIKALFVSSLERE
ncbi:MAG: ornithine carbamoyltransferase [Kiritimatiellia bacterium]|jgi:ornithine carbamoyltransferase|nr:ornithine carbamoyltransferase [Kiritimatiellia bacterium]MDP6630544.1 ornithine carbamoyltransferase [Kiritimatiellia bacterium]MDP6811218.1 ornithine carbamoyltransferase [Kiritimatiellia bacterium]MDP7024337.1 ornithine carbamoyltransferase [Kiritimatiellia bacterium]